MDGHHAKAPPEAEPRAAGVSEAPGSNPSQSVTGAPAAQLLLAAAAAAQTCSLILMCRDGSQLPAAAPPALSAVFGF